MAELEPVVSQVTPPNASPVTVEKLNPLVDPGWRLKLVVIISGAVLMALEITGSRVLATHFGSSIYVWGAIIGVFLAALAGGYYSGGIVADRRPTFFLLNLILLAAGCWLLIIPFYANWLCRAVRYMNFGERLNPLIATVLLFGGPSVLLGMVSPFAVRLAARSVENIGNLSGRLYALSTVGSIAGTLITAFWLIPAFGVRTLLSALGACLILLPLIVLTKSRRTVFLFAPIVLLLVAAVYLTRTQVTTPRRADQKVLYDGDSAYHHILVVDDLRSNTRYLQFNNQIESAIDLNPPYETRAAYTDAFQLARIFQPKLERVLIIGGGGGVGARKFVSDDSNVVVDLVEIDERVVGISERFFYLNPGPRLRIYNDEGRSFVRGSHERYDLVVLDAYTIGGQIPFHLTTQEFMREIKGILKPGGVVLANINGTLEGSRSQILRAEYKTMATVFRSLYVFPLPREAERGQNKTLDPTLRRNVILVASDDYLLNKDSIVSQSESLYRDGMVRTRTFLEDARNFLTTPLRTTDVPLLTDEYAPVDTMLF